MAHRYVSTADFRAPYDAPTLALQGLGNDWDRRWPRGRSYQSTANFRAPYDNGYYQNNSLFGLGAAQLPEQARLLALPLPAAFQRFVTTGEPMPSWKRDLGGASAQVPRLAWGGAAVVLAGLGYWSYRSWKKKKKGGA